MNRYFLNIDTATNTTANWSDTSGGAGGFSIPTSTDDVFFDANSGDCIVFPALACKSIDFTNYSNSITCGAVLTVYGNVTLSPTMTVISTTASMNIVAASTITSNGKSWDTNLIFSSSAVITLADNWNVTSLLTLNTCTVNHTTTEVLSTSGGLFTQGGSTSGTCKIEITGGTWYTSSFGVVLYNNLDINGNITIGNVSYGTGTLTKVSGTVNYGTGTLYLISNPTLTGFSSEIFYNLSIYTNMTFTHDINVGNKFEGGNNGFHTYDGFTIYCSTLYVGNGSPNGGIKGTTNIVLNGSGTWTTAGGSVTNNLTINTSGTLTISGNVYYATGTLTYTTGTVITTGSALYLTGNCTLNTSGINWYDVWYYVTAGVFTLTSNLNIDNKLEQVSGSNITVNGSDVFVGGDLIVASSYTTKILGTSTIHLIGTGTWSGGQTIANLNINTAGTITLGSNVGVGNGTTTYTAGTIINSGSTLIVSAQSSTHIFDTSGMTWNHISFNGTGQIITLTSDLNIAGDFIVPSYATINGNNVNVGGNMTFTRELSGTTNINYIGTGTWTNLDPANSTLKVNLTINTIGTLTISGIVYYNTGTLTYISGNIIATGSTLNINASSTLDTDGMIWNNVTFSGGSVTATLLSDFYLSGTCLISGARTFNGFTLYCGGNLTVNANNFGTTLFVLNGTGTWSGSALFTRDLTINTSGTITLSGTVQYYGTLTYTAGTVVSTGATLSITSNATLNTGSVVWDNVLIGVSGSTSTLNSTFNCNVMTLTSAGFHTFAGTAGFTCNTFISTTAGRNIRLTAGNTYNVLQSLTFTGTSVSPTLFYSLTSAHVYFNVYGSQNVQYINATYIDSSGGQTVKANIGSILSNTVNWSISEGDWFDFLN